MIYHIVSLGGSLIVPDGIDTAFLRKFVRLISKFVSAGNRRVIIIAGGGSVCRKYNIAATRLARPANVELDRIGIRATKLNAEFLRVLFGKQAHPEVLENPDVRVTSSKKILIGSGWKPGWSSDMAAVHFARTYGAQSVTNVSNVATVYHRDPKRYRSARPLLDLTWDQYLKLIPHTWRAGLSTPFDPVASRTAKQRGLSVAIVNGTRSLDVEKALNNLPFHGTVIHA